MEGYLINAVSRHFSYKIKKINFMKINNRHRIIILILTALLYTITGCAYYNVYYNAQKAYNEALKQVENSSSTDISPEAKARFDLAIEKASKVLQLYPGSRWADDALIMIGRSYYFQGNFPDAIEKFEELFSVFPDSKFVPEARSLYSKTLLNEGKFDLAEIELNEIIEADTKEKFKSEAYLSLAELRYFRDDYDGAIELYKRILIDIKDKKIKAEAQLKIAESYFENERYDLAAVEYEKVKDHDPSPVQQFTSEFGLGICLEYLEDYDGAIAKFVDLLAEEDFVSNHAELLLEIARCWDLKEDYYQAILVLENLNQYDIESPPSLEIIASSQFAVSREDQLPDSLRAIQDPLAGFRQATDKNPEALYNIGELYLKKISDMFKAKTYFTRGFAVGSIQEIGPRLNLRIRHISEIQRLSVDQYKAGPIEPVYIPPPDTTIGPDSTVTISPVVLPEPGFKAYSDSIEFDSAIEKYSEDLENYKLEVTSSMFRIAEIFFTEFDMPDSAVIYLEKIIDKFGDSPNAPKALSLQIEIANEYDIYDTEQLKTELMSTYEGTMFAKMYSDNPDAYVTKSDIEPTTIDSAQVLFENAESAYFQEEYIEAVDIYNSLISRYKDNDLTPKALYAVALIYENLLNDPGNAVLAYEKLNAQYKDSEVGQALSFKLNEIYKLREAQKREERLEQLRQQVADDKLAAVEKAFQDSINIEIMIEQYDGDDEKFILSLESDSMIAKAAELISYGESTIADSISGLDVEGYIYLKILINAVGLPTESEIFKNTTNNISLGKSVMDVSKQFIFSPATDPQVRPTDAWHLMRFRFPLKLEGD